MVNSNIRSGNKVVDDYIDALENELKRFGISNTKRLISEIDGMAGAIADKLHLLNKQEKYPNGEEVELSGKEIDSFIKLAEKADKIKAFTDIAESMYGVVSKKGITDDDITTELPQSSDISFFERAEMKVKEKLKNGKV
jgi:hypothetical protein